MIFNSFLFPLDRLDKTAKEISGSKEQPVSLLTRNRQLSDSKTDSSETSGKQSNIDASKLIRKKLQSPKNLEESTLNKIEVAANQEETNHNQSVVTRVKDDRSSRIARSDLKSNQRVPSSSFLQSSSSVKSQDSIENSITDRNLDRELPKPAPRSTQSSTKHASSPAITTFAASAGSSGSAPTGAKRINNPRQNHGRAVAPPQLPVELSSSPSSAMRSDNIEQILPTNDSILHLMGDDNVVDFSQSPIAQRLLKQSKDYKGSLATNLTILLAKKSKLD